MAMSRQSLPPVNKYTFIHHVDGDGVVRHFFDERISTTQSLWMDMALARRSGQELRNSYIITNSPEYASLRRFFKATVEGLQLVFDRSLVTATTAPLRTA